MPARAIVWVSALLILSCLACFEGPVSWGGRLGADSLSESVWITVPDVLFDAVRVRFFGPVEHTISLTANGTDWTGPAPTLQNGRYDIVVMGIASGEIDHIDLVRGLVFDDNLPPGISVTMETFRPTVRSLAIDDTTHVSVVFGAVEHASFYTVEHDNTADFTSAESISTADTSLVFVVDGYGRHYVRIRAGNEYVPAGRASEIDSVNVVDTVVNR